MRQGVRKGGAGRGAPDAFAGCLCRPYLTVILASYFAPPPPLYTSLTDLCFLITPEGLVPLWEGFWSKRLEIYAWSNVLCGLRGHKCTAPLVERLNARAGIPETVSASCTSL